MSGPARAFAMIFAAWILAISSNSSFSAAITGDVDTLVTVRVDGQIVPGDAQVLATLALSLKRELKRKNARDLNWLHISLNSEGGTVREALAIGRFLRRHNAAVRLFEEDECLSSCVFILMAGVMRAFYGLNATVGVHRPFLFSADTDQDFEHAYLEMRTELDAYFDEMHITRTLLDLMYSIPPGEMRVLSTIEIDTFLPFMDPVYEERVVTAEASYYGITNFDYRSRKNNAQEECRGLLPDVDGYDNCREAILWGLTLEEYLLRNALSRKACLEEALDRSALRVPRGLNARDCRIYVMRHGV